MSARVRRVRRGPRIRPGSAGPRRWRRATRRSARDRSSSPARVIPSKYRRDPGERPWTRVVLSADRHDRRHVDIATILAYYHCGPPEQRLDLGHTTWLGEPWVKGSRLTHMLISLPSPTARSSRSTSTPAATPASSERSRSPKTRRRSATSTASRPSSRASRTRASTTPTRAASRSDETRKPPHEPSRGAHRHLTTLSDRERPLIRGISSKYRRDFSWLDHHPRRPREQPQGRRPHIPKRRITVFTGVLGIWGSHRSCSTRSRRSRSG